MATIEEGSVFEYCEGLFVELIDKDGGYHPSKHDVQVFKQAAKRFGITTDDVNRIYSTYSKIAADREIDKINKLPKAIRQKVIKRELQNIVLNNHDLPFYKIEGDPTEPLTSALDVLEEEYRGLIEKIAKAGWTLPLTLKVQQLEEIRKSIDDIEALDTIFVNFYSNKEFLLMCRHIRLAMENAGQQKVLEECIDIYRQGLYSACITALTVVLEGFISSFGDDPRDVRVMRICKFHADETKKKGKMLQSLCWLSLYEFTRIFFDKSDFDKVESPVVNRHWISHGRTSRIGEQADCLRVFNAISTLACIKKYSTKVK